MMKKQALLCLLALLLTAGTAPAQGAEDQDMKGSMKGSMMKPAGTAETKQASPAEQGLLGRAVVTGTQPGSPIQGTVTLTPSPDGLRVEARLSGLGGPGKFGFHIHEYGSCGDSGKAAGGHFDPLKTGNHGFLPKEGIHHVHAGDMGNIESGDNGEGQLDLVLKGVSLYGPAGAAGRAVILHAQPDDFGQPTGNAGARIACGTIFVTALE